MTRLAFPSGENSLVYSLLGGRGFIALAGTPVAVYRDAALTSLADIRNADGTPTATAGTVLADATSRVPDFLGPDDALEELWLLPAGSSVPTRIYAKVQDRLARYAANAVGVPLNVKDFGATGDGATDDSTALTAAFAAAANAELYFPPGTYLADKLTLPAGVTLTGAGAGTTLRKKAGTTGRLLTALDVDGIAVRDLVLDGNRANVSDVNSQTLHIENCDRVRVENVLARNTQNAGMEIRNSTDVGVAHFDATDCLYGLLMVGVTRAQVSGGRLHASRAGTAFEGGLYLLGVTDSSFDGVKVTGGVGNGLSVGGASKDLTFTGCAFDDNGTAGGDRRGVNISDVGTTRLTFAGCQTNRNAEAGVYSTPDATDLIFTGHLSVGNNTALADGGHGFEILSPGSTLNGCIARDQLGSVAGAGVGFFLSSGVRAVGCRAVRNYSDGFVIYNATAAAVTDSIASNNSQRGAGLHHGVRVFGDYPGAVNDITIAGNLCYDDQGSKTQSFGISIEANVDRYVLTDNISRAAAHVTGGISDPNLGVTKVRRDNLDTGAVSGNLHPLPPERTFNSLAVTAAWTAGGTRDLGIGGVGSIPAGVCGVFVSVTCVGYSPPLRLVLHAQGSPPPGGYGSVSTVQVNSAADETVPVFVPVNRVNGQITVYSNQALNGTSQGLIFDVHGYVL